MYDLNQRKLTSFYETYLGTLENRTQTNRVPAVGGTPGVWAIGTDFHAINYLYRPWMTSTSIGETFATTHPLAVARGIAKECTPEGGTYGNTSIGYVPELIRNHCIGVEASNSKKT